MANTREPLKVLILDNWTGNVGDAAILLAMHDSIRAALGEDTIIKSSYCGLTSDPGPLANCYPEVTFVRNLWHAVSDGRHSKSRIDLRFIRQTSGQRFLAAAKNPFLKLLLTPEERKVFKEFEEADLIVVTGGVPLATLYTNPRLRFQRCAQYHLAKALGKPLVFYAQSFGPFAPDDIFPSMLKPCLDMADAVVARSPYGEKTARERIGTVNPTLAVTIDDVVTLQSRVPTRSDIPDQKMPRRIGMVLHKWAWLGHENAEKCQAEFEERTTTVCRKLLERGDTEILFGCMHPVMAGAEFSEEDVAERVISGLPEALRARTHLIHGFVHPRELSHVLGHCDFVIASRLHAAILSLTGGTRAIALAYEPKTRGLYELLGLPDWALSMGDSSAEEILAVAQSLIDHPEVTTQRYREAIARGRERAMENRRILQRVMSKRLPHIAERMARSTVGATLASIFTVRALGIDLGEALTLAAEVF